MIVTCVDSSALLRLCLVEGDVALVRQAMSRSPTASVLAAVEVPAAIAARFHRGLLTADDRDQRLALATTLLRATSQVGLTAAVRQEAVAISMRFLVRSLDAIHLATAVVLTRQQRRHGNDVRFCTADLRQAAVAQALFGASLVDVVPPFAPSTS